MFGSSPSAFGEGRFTVRGEKKEEWPEMRLEERK
jgi:hypothetical protein